MKSSWGDLFNAGQQAYQSGAQDVMSWLDSIKPSFTTDGDFGYDVFPEDLSSSYYGHWMTLTAITPMPGSGISTATGAGASAVTEILGTIGVNVPYQPPSNPTYTVGIFIPSEVGGGGGMMYMDKHEYTDVRLTNLGGNMLGAASSGAITAAGLIAPALGHPINPGVEVLYRSTGLRRFEYSFLLAPSSEKESMSMQSIIKNLRKFAAPKQNESYRFLFDTPAEWEIKFYFHGQENTNIPKIRRCVLTDINLNYSPQGEWSTFRNGHPVACMLTLGFNEMEIITRQHVNAGY